MENKKRNIIPFIIGVATLVLAGVGIFTALKLFQLRNEGIAPNSPESKPGAESFTIEVINTNNLFFDEITFLNASGKDQNMDFIRDSWDNNTLDETIKNVFVKSGESYKITAFPGVCTKFQIDARFSEDAITQGETYWRRGFVTEKSNNPNCTNPTATPVNTPAGTTSPNTCTINFTIFSDTETATPTSTPTGTPTPTSTVTPTTTSTGTPVPTATPNISTPQPTPAPTSTPRTLPLAGVSLPTLAILSGSAILTIMAILLAI